MSRPWENPVRRHASRISAAGGPWTVGLVLLASAALGLLLVRYWMGLEVYSLQQAHGATRWAGVLTIAEGMLVLSWASIRGTLIWLTIVREGTLDEYRRTRLSALSIVVGVLAA